MSAASSFRVVEENGASTVFLTGDIDLERSPLARSTLLATVKKGKPVIVDLSQVEYMDSSGVASLVEAFQRARAGKIEFSLQRVSDQVRKVLTLARLDKIFTIK
ncbi:MAG TPA: STAS domain-containing protein [Nevskiaceae bacterium]|nr:STAS domain-containing protein [Nevskiaceae bacterium]